METWKDSRYLYEGRIIKLRVGEAALDNATLVHREVIEHPGGVGVVPLVDGHIILVRQYRIALGKDVLEIPAGRREGTEDPAARAAAECEEEISYIPDHLLHVAAVYTSPGCTDQLDDIFLAFDLEETERKPEFDENIEIVRVPLSEIESMLDRQAFNDGKTVIGLRELFAYLRNHLDEAAQYGLA
jgi:ADP-ribose diphosphatase